MNIDTVLFDLDGTLVDSMWMWRQIDIEYLRQFGYELPEKLQKDIEGMSFTETAIYFKETFHLPRTLDEIKSEWNEMTIEKYRTEVSFKPGAKEFLIELKEHGMKTAICTSNSRQLAETVVDALDMRKYIDFIITACDVEKGKPSPDIYLKAAEVLGAAPEQCIVFEDIPAGIQAGKAAGMRVIAVEDDFSGDMKEEKMELADRFIETYNELLI